MGERSDSDWPGPPADRLHAPLRERPLVIDDPKAPSTAAPGGGLRAVAVTMAAAA